MASRRIGQAVAAILLVAVPGAIGGCAARYPGPRSCLLAAENPMTLITLYFGRDMPGGGVVSDGQWAGFVSSVLGAIFPDGFTVYDGSGQWRDRAGRIGREPSKIVQIAVAADEAGLAGRVSRVSAAYRTQFHQDAVGAVTQEVCGAF